MRIDIRLVGFVCLCSAALVGACNGHDDTKQGTVGAIACDGSCATVDNAGVGDPCTDDNQAMASFSGFSVTEVNVESRTPQCGTGMCLTYGFQGRKGCPYGVGCTTPGGDPVTVPVNPQLLARSPNDSMYCSCRCDGPSGTGPFCACPQGFECRKLIPDLGFDSGEQLAGSYCVKAGTPEPNTLVSGPVCDASLSNCEGR